MSVEQVAAEDFVQACMEAHGLGIGLKELQLQLVLQDGSLTGAFSIRNQIWSEDPILNEVCLQGWSHLKVF